MSLTWRFLIVLVVLNLGVFGAVLGVSWSLQDQWVRDQQDNYGRVFQNALRDAAVGVAEYSLRDLAALDGRRLRALLRLSKNRSLFRDAVVTNGKAPADNAVFLNLLGAVHRDPAGFPEAEIRRGLARAQSERTLIPVGDGYCMPIVHDDRAQGAIWYALQVPPPPPPTPIWVVAVALVVSVLAFGLLAWWTFNRTLIWPLRALGGAAARIGSGDYRERVPAMGGARELEEVIQAFNTMAQKVEGNADELAREVRLAVAETRRKEQALVLSSRMAAMGSLAAGIAHEINNPIGGMLNAVHRLQQRADLEDRDRTYLELVREGLERVGATARKVLDFSPRDVAGAPFPIADAVTGAHALVEHRFTGEGIGFVAAVPADLPLIRGDRHEIQQVFLNLFLNSLDAFAEAGRTGTVRVSVRRAGEVLQVAVDDDGPGVPAADLQRIMDPFFTRKARPDASGLGMSICYTIVRNHGGDMEVESEEGRGFRVRIGLPVGE